MASVFYAANLTRQVCRGHETLSGGFNAITSSASPCPSAACLCTRRTRSAAAPRLPRRRSACTNTAPRTQSVAARKKKRWCDSRTDQSWEHARLSSCSSWETITTAPSNFFTAAASDRIDSRSAASANVSRERAGWHRAVLPRWLVGSSSTRMCGWGAQTLANCTRAFWPPESTAMGFVASSPVMPNAPILSPHRERLSARAPSASSAGCAGRGGSRTAGGRFGRHRARHRGRAGPSSPRAAFSRARAGRRGAARTLRRRAWTCG